MGAPKEVRQSKDKKKLMSLRHQLFLYLYLIKFILKEEFLGVAQSEKPEFTKRK